jgi:CRISPR/Cas system CMR subunit Cmr4 (Cas7 group RAMP superfamily)
MILWEVPVATKTDQIKLTYDLAFETLFHCGTGIRTGLVDRTVTRDSKQHLYIPGSTFKGTLRERCEQLARFYKIGGIETPHNAEAALGGLGTGKPTLITRIFGSQTTAGRLFFDDARQDEASLKQYGISGQPGAYKGLQVDLYTQVRISRPTHTAVQGALYTSEFGTKDITFRGVIQGWLEDSVVPALAHTAPAPTYSLLLLLAGLKLLDRLGGNKSTGKGKCACQITSLEVEGTPCLERLPEWFEQLDDLASYEKEE